LDKEDKLLKDAYESTRAPSKAQAVPVNHQGAKDLAMKGGIDLTRANMNLQAKVGPPSGVFGIDKGGIKFRLTPAMLQQLQNAPGFVPVIISIQPMTNLRQFLGLDIQQSSPRDI
jgi:hypothetical protein